MTEPAYRNKPMTLSEAQERYDLLVSLQIHLGYVADDYRELGEAQMAKEMAELADNYENEKEDLAEYIDREQAAEEVEAARQYEYETTKGGY